MSGLVGLTMLKINGVEVGGVTDVSWKPTPVERKAAPRALGKFEASFTVTMSAEDSERWREAIEEMLAAQPRYWRRRREHQVKRLRRRVARALGVSYATFRRFCCTGAWS